MDDNLPGLSALSCPTPLSHQDIVVMGHGSGGRMMHDLIARHFFPKFENPILSTENDASVISVPFSANQADQPFRLAVSTDSHVVSPLFFQGGDIGRLAVCGTVNDLAMSGAKPLYLTAGFILEEGLEMDVLDRVVDSMKLAADEAQVQLIAGDTKVVQRGKGDQLYINTTGIGVLQAGVNIGGDLAKVGDRIIISGTIGDHGVAVLEARGELGFESGIPSDAAPLNHLVQDLIRAGIRIHVLRDPTRGGLATTLNEIARQSHVGILIQEGAIPVKPAVLAVCEMLGLDPMYIANEGKLVAVVEAEDASRAVDLIKLNRYGVDAGIIGEVTSSPSARVLMKTTLHTTRVVDMLTGELLPRIC